MSAAELIEKIKALPPSELAEVRNFLLNGDSSEPKFIDREKARVIGTKVMEEHAELFRKLAQ